MALRKVRRERDGLAVERSLQALKKAAVGNDNLMPYFLKCVRIYATLGEICDTLREVFGEYKEPPIY